MRSIAEASAEQSGGVQQVNKTITEMDKVVQQNASAVQESASAAEGMRAQADVLMQAVSRFRLAEDDLGAQAEATARRPTSADGVHRLPSRSTGPPHAPAKADGDEWQQF
jgi:hypothetical protein